MNGNPIGLPLRVAILAVIIAACAGSPARASDETLSRPGAEILFARGLVALHDGDADRARRLFALASNLRPDDPVYAYRAGLALYRSAHPVAAERYLRRALKTAPSNSPARFTLGLVLIDLGRHEEAYRALALVGPVPSAPSALSAPSDVPDVTPGERGFAAQVWYYAGVAALRAGHERAGLDLMRQVVSLGFAGSGEEAGEAPPAPPAGILSDARWYLDRAGRRPARWSWSLEAGTTVEWDDDPAILGDDLRAVIDRREGDDGDRRLVGAVRAAGARTSDSSAWSAGIQIEGYGSRHEELRSLDQLAPRVQAHIARGRDPLGVLPGPLGPMAVPNGRSAATVTIQADASYVWLDGDSFVRSASGAVGLGVHPAAWSRVRLEAIAEERRYYGTYASRSGPVGTGRLSHDFLMAAPEGTLTLGRSWSTTDADGVRVDRDDDGTPDAFDARAFDRDGKGWFAKLSLSIGRAGAFQLEWARRESDYDVPFPGTSLVARKARRDLRTDRAATLTIPVRSGWSVTARHARIERSSSVEPLAYDRSITSIAAVWRHR